MQGKIFVIFAFLAATLASELTYQDYVKKFNKSQTDWIGITGIIHQIDKQFDKRSNVQMLKHCAFRTQITQV